MYRDETNDNLLASRVELRDTLLERTLIYSLLSGCNSTGYVSLLAQVLSDDDFTDPEHRTAWHLIKRCKEDGQEVNALNVYAQSQAAGLEFHPERYIAGVADGDAWTLGVALHSVGQRRRLVEGGDGRLPSLNDVLRRLTDDRGYDSGAAVADLERIVADYNKGRAVSCTPWSALHGKILEEAQLKAEGKIPDGVRCGFSLIDNKGGLEAGELMVVAGRNSNGKTSLALCMALNAAMQGAPVGVFSLEMTTKQLGTRLLSLLSGVDGERIKRGRMDQEEWDRVAGANDRLPIYFDERRESDVDAMVGNIRAMHEQRGVRVVVVDYLQLMRSRERDKAQQIGGIAHRMEALSKKLEITIILLSQLRREVGPDPTPHMSELKESGDIADAADSIYLVYRPERHGKDLKYPDMEQRWSQYSTEGTALLMCKKNRNGALAGEQLLKFDAPTTRFYEGGVFEIDNNLHPGEDFSEVAPF